MTSEHGEVDLRPPVAVQIELLDGTMTIAVEIAFAANPSPVRTRSTATGEPDIDLAKWRAFLRTGSQAGEFNR